MPQFNIVHKHQTKLNDCWYACMQMLRTHRANGTKVKPMGSGVNNHRKAGFANGGFWGQTLGQDDTEFDTILQQNKLKLLNNANLTSTAAIQATLDLHGPIMVGGDFGKIGRIRGTHKWMLEGLGHFVVVAGVNQQSGKVQIHDPWHTRGTEMSFTDFNAQVWKDGITTVIANNLAV